MTTPRKAQRAEVWHVLFKARPSADHPTLPPDRDGVLAIIIIAPGRQTALQKALLVFSALPFQSAGDDILVASATELRASGTKPEDVACLINLTSTSGLAVTFNAETPARG